MNKVKTISIDDTIAVILPIYIKDKVEYVARAVESIFRQTYPNFHLFIGVDGKVGNDIQEYIHNFDNFSNISVIWFKENRGLACVLNDLLDICFKEGYEYIARMDADDISASNRFEKQITYLMEHPEVDVVGGAIAEIDENGGFRNKVIVYPETHEECRVFFSRRNPHAHPAVLFRKRFFDKIGGKYRSEYRRNQDTMLWYDGLMAGTIHANIPDVVLEYRITNSLFENRRSGWAFAKKQLDDRKLINRGLGYGASANIFAYAMFVLLVSPAWVKKMAYRFFR